MEGDAAETDQGYETADKDAGDGTARDEGAEHDKQAKEKEGLGAAGGGNDRQEKIGNAGEKEDAASQGRYGGPLVMLVITLRQNYKGYEAGAPPTMTAKMGASQRGKMVFTSWR